jgi:hypothetical protein
MVFDVSAATAGSAFLPWLTKGYAARDDRLSLPERNPMATPSEAQARAQFAALAARVFPDLPADELRELERAWNHVARWVARLPHDPPFEAEPAHIFKAPERQP